MLDIRMFKSSKGKILSKFRPDLKEGEIPNGIEVETVPEKGLDFFAIMGSEFWMCNDILVHKSNAQFGLLSSFCQDQEPQIRAFKIDRPMLIEKVSPPFGEYKVTWMLRCKKERQKHYKENFSFDLME